MSDRDRAFMEMKVRIAELEAENERLREALERAASGKYVAELVALNALENSHE